MKAQGNQLDEIGLMYGFNRDQNESDDNYRQRLIQKWNDVSEKSKKDFLEKRSKLIKEKGYVSLTDIFGKNGLLTGGEQ